MFWFDYHKMSELISFTFDLDAKIKSRISKSFKAKTGIELTFTSLDVYLVKNNDYELHYINILHDVCCDLFDIDSKINSIINDDLFYENQTIINNTGSFGTTELVFVDGKTMVKKTPKAYYESLDEEYRFMKNLYLENNDYFVKTTKDDFTDSYLMELASDSLLSYITEKAAIDDAERMLIVNIIIDEVDFIHKQGIIHNDLHPENILLFKYGNDLKWKLSDFGMSYKLLEQKFVVSKLTVTSRKSDYVNYHVGNNTIQNDFYSIAKLINFIYTKNPKSTNHPFYNICKKCLSGKFHDALEIKREFNLIACKNITN